ncbi:hypothetical protein NQZ68_029827 [Dissostichus eleginoides]|nr:hypothetical protein NQZ68_029827 [Dissostichus eleginoides]
MGDTELRVRLRAWLRVRLRALLALEFGLQGATHQPEGSGGGMSSIRSHARLNYDWSCSRLRSPHCRSLDGPPSLFRVHGLRPSVKGFLGKLDPGRGEKDREPPSSHQLRICPPPQP